jgi:hypothetical protein
MKITLVYNDYPSISQGYINRAVRSFESFLKKQKIEFENLGPGEFFGNTNFKIWPGIGFEDLDSKWDSYKQTKSLYSPLQSFEIKNR